MIENDELPAPVSARVTAFELVVSLSDGRRIATPLAWYPLLMTATEEQRARYEVSPFGVHWPDLDEDLSVAGMFAGTPASDDHPSEFHHHAAPKPDPQERESFARWNVEADNDNPGIAFWIGSVNVSV